MKSRSEDLVLPSRKRGCPRANSEAIELYPVDVDLTSSGSSAPASQSARPRRQLKVTSLEEPWVTLIASRGHPLDSLSYTYLLHMIFTTDMTIPYATMNNPVILLASKIFRMDLIIILHRIQFFDLAKVLYVCENPPERVAL